MPRERPGWGGKLRYDSTVNRLERPDLYVTYHDAQAYPEYVIKFSQETEP